MPDHVNTRPGVKLSHYILKEPLGQGNFTQTWRAIDHRDNAEVALRIFSNWLGHAPTIRERLEQEVAKLQLISHPALVPIACAEFHEGEAPSFVATPFIKGASLMRWRAANSVPDTPAALKMLAPVIAAAATLHQNGVVHENIRPSNIVLDSAGRAYLTDSDLSRVFEKLDDPLPGCYEYLSPERLEGRPTSPSSDVYSIGVVLYELLTGLAPFNGTVDEVRHAARNEAPCPANERNPAIPDWVAKVVTRCLDKDPQGRYKDAVMLQKALGLEEAASTGEALKVAQFDRAKLRAIALDPVPSAKWPTFAKFGALAAALALAGWAGMQVGPSGKPELERLKRYDWRHVGASEMPSNCQGYQPCLDRRAELERGANPTR